MKISVDRQRPLQIISGRRAVPERALDHAGVVVEESVFRPKSQGLLRSAPRVGVQTALEQSPREEIVTVNILARIQLLSRLGKNFWDSPVVVKQKQRPGKVFN